MWEQPGLEGKELSSRRLLVVGLELHPFRKKCFLAGKLNGFLFDLRFALEILREEYEHGFSVTFTQNQGNTPLPVSEFASRTAISWKLTVNDRQCGIGERLLRDKSNKKVQTLKSQPN